MSYLLGQGVTLLMVVHVTVAVVRNASVAVQPMLLPDMS